MADINLTQAEAYALMAMEKHRVDEQDWPYPGLGDSTSIPLVSADKREHFLLDISRGSIDLLRGKYQERGRQAVILARLDFGGGPHRNPDGQEIPCPHLHVYREGFGDKWAFPASKEAFPRTADLWETLQDFMRFCNVTKPPVIRRGLWA